MGTREMWWALALGTRHHLGLPARPAFVICLFLFIFIKQQPR